MWAVAKGPMGEFNVVFYLVFIAASTAGLYLSSIHISPYLLGHIFPLISVGARINSILLVTILGLTSAFPAGIVFGFSLGFWVSIRPGYQAFWVALSASTILMIYTGVSLWDAGVVPGQFYWRTIVAEVFLFMGIFVLTAIGANRLAANTGTRIRKVVAFIFCLVFFIAIYI